MVTNSMTCKSITLLCSTLIEEENCIYKDIVEFIVKYVTIWKYSIISTLSNCIFHRVIGYQI